MKFKVGKLYRVVKDWNPDCVDCILKYEGKDKDGDHRGKPVKTGKRCHPNYSGYCRLFQYTINEPDKYKMVEHIDMVKFCKKLRKQRKKAT